MMENEKDIKSNGNENKKEYKMERVIAEKEKASDAELEKEVREGAFHFIVAVLAYIRKHSMPLFLGFAMGVTVVSIFDSTKNYELLEKYVDYVEHTMSQENGKMGAEVQKSIEK